MDYARHICEKLLKLYPNETFVAMSSYGWYEGDYEEICNYKEIRVFKLRSSKGDRNDNVELTSLLQRVVFETRNFRDRGQRRDTLYQKIRNLIPTNFVNVIIEPQSEAELPRVYGAHKGIAYFWEVEFGDHVTVIAM